MPLWFLYKFFQLLFYDHQIKLAKMYFWPQLLESFIIAPCLPCWRHGLTLHFGAK